MIFFTIDSYDADEDFGSLNSQIDQILEVTNSSDKSWIFKSTFVEL